MYFRKIYNMEEIKLDEKDIQILKLLQENCKGSMRKIARAVNSPITTVHAKIKRMKKLGIIKSYIHKSLISYFCSIVAINLFHHPVKLLGFGKCIVLVGR